MSPRRQSTSGRRRQFGKTWWGAAWITALEHRARLDPNRLPRGRSYARWGAVNQLELSRGVVRALVQGSRPKPYRVAVRVREFTPSEWELALDAIAAQVGHAAALLDGELPPEILDDVASVGVELLPRAGEVQPRCSCPDWADPCKHSAAVCYLVADALDADPFGLLLLRGRDREQVLAALRARRTVAAPAGRADPNPLVDTDRGIPARIAYAEKQRPPLPVPPLPPSQPGQPATVPVGWPDVTEPLRALAADAAARAWSLAVGEGDGALCLDFEADLARRAARALGAPEFEQLAARAGKPSAELARSALAWQVGGAAGLAVLTETWRPPDDAVEEGRAALGPGAGVRMNRVTLGSVQLRLGRDGLWYRFRRNPRGWDADGSPEADPAALVPS